MKWNLPFPIAPSEDDPTRSDDVLVYVNERMVVAYYDMEVEGWFMVDANSNCIAIGSEIDYWAELPPKPQN
jgi:hypothetical protein